jgi:hypothetical protein
MCLELRLAQLGLSLTNEVDIVIAYSREAALCRENSQELFQVLSGPKQFELEVMIMARMV